MLPEPRGALDPACGDQGPDRLQAPSWRLRRQTLSRCRQHARLAVRCQGSGPGLGHGHHLHQNLRGICLFCGRHRPLFPPCYRLGYTEPPDHRCRAASPRSWQSGGASQKRRCWSTRIRDRSSQHGLGIVSETPQSGSLDEPSGELDNAVVESFFNLLKRERIRCKVYRSRDEARVRTCSTTSRCSTTRNANTSGMECCHRRVRATAETVTRGGVYETRGYSIRSKIIRL